MAHLVRRLRSLTHTYGQGVPEHTCLVFLVDLLDQLEMFWVKVRNRLWVGLLLITCHLNLDDEFIPQLLAPRAFFLKVFFLLKYNFGHSFIN